jgi:DNA-binding NtrC family response regulator
MVNKIVVVDDEPMIVKTLKRLFRKQPFVFYGFDSPRRALERLDGIAPQVVLSDQRMPEMEGVRFLERVREKCPDTVRMIMTGFDIPENAFQAIRRGDVSTILQKPWEDDHLLRTIHDAFYYCDSMRRLKVHHCVVCGERVSAQPIRVQDSFDMCPRCSHWYELLPGVLMKSLRRLILGNVL